MLYTTNYNLNLYELEDDANLADGYNNSMERIDQYLYRANSLITSANATITNHETRIGSLETSLTTISNEVAKLGNCTVSRIYNGCPATTVTCNADTASFMWLIVTLQDSNANQSTHLIRGGAQGQVYTHCNTVNGVTSVVWGGLSCNGMTLSNVFQLNMQIDDYTFEGSPQGTNNISMLIANVHGISYYE